MAMIKSLQDSQKASQANLLLVEMEDDNRSTQESRRNDGNIKISKKKHRRVLFSNYN